MTPGLREPDPELLQVTWEEVAEWPRPRVEV